MAKNYILTKMFLLFAKVRLLVTKIYNLNPQEKYLNVEILIATVVSKLLIVLMPFKYYSKFFGRLTNEKILKDDIKLDQEANLIFRMIETQSKFIPWKHNCLSKTLTASIMLRKRKLSFTTLFGLRRGTDTMSILNAHAWIEVTESASLGKDSQNLFTNIAVYNFDANK